MCFTIKQVETEEEFKHYYHLRWQLLRAPWNQPEGSEVDDVENQCFHFIAVENHNKVIGIARLQFNSNSEAQIRYMAVAESHQGKGIGRELVNAVELHAKEPPAKKQQTGNSSCEKIVLDAREAAVGFYQKLGYNVVEKTYVSFDEIQHYRMVKNLRHL